MTVTEKKTTKHNDVATMKKRKHSEVEEEEEESEILHVVVRRVGKAENESLVLELSSDATVLDLKEKIVEALKEQDEIVIPVERQRLIFSGKMLRDETLSLEADLNMKPGDEHKHFVHLTPLPKGAAPSVRTDRELSENPMSPHEATLQRARARQRRRRRQEPRSGLSDPAAYHPYALDLASGSLMPTAVAASPAVAAAAASLVAAPSAGEAALLSMAAAQQSHLVASRAVLPDALQAVVLAQQHQNLLASNSAAAVLANAAVLCPDVLTSLLARPVVQPAPTDTTTALLQELLARQQQPPQPRNDILLPEILEQIAANAGELANTLRLLGLPPPSTPQVAMSDLARRLLLEERLAALTSSSSSAGSFLPGSLPGFF